MDDSDGNECRHYYQTVAFMKHVYDTISLTPKQIESIRSTNGSTPLLRACRYGYNDIVVTLLDEYHANIEEVGRVTFELVHADRDREPLPLRYFIENKDAPTMFSYIYEDISPLFCAAMAGEFKVVKTLVIYKASINCRNKEGSTALHAACMEGSLDIVKYLVEHGADIEIPNYEGRTCLMIACKFGFFKIAEYLIQRGCDVNRKTISGTTALHCTATWGSLLTLDILLNSSAKLEKDFFGVTPILSGAISGQECVIEFFIMERLCSNVEIANALDLLGATYMKKHEYHKVRKGLSFWRRSLCLRSSDLTIPKKGVANSPLSNIINTVEISTFEQLKALDGDLEAIDKQCLLIRERVLGIGHLECSRHILLYCDECYSLDERIRLQIYALDGQHKIMESFNWGTRCNAMSLLYSFFRLPQDQVSVYLQDILKVLSIVVKEIRLVCSTPRLAVCSGKELEDLNDFLFQAVPLIKLLCRLELEEGDKQEFNAQVEQLVEIDPRAVNNLSVLHLACFNSISSVKVINLLLKCGADPNAVDNDGNTPLHIVAVHSDWPETVVESLLKHGAHVDYRNQDRKTAFEMMKISTIQPFQYLNLQCLSAQVVKSIDLPYRNRVPKHIELFLDFH